jgi:hypothetical protein
MLDAHGDILRGLQVVEAAAAIPQSMMGQKLEGTSNHVQRG